MRIYLCSDYIDKIKLSGVGRAIEHQQMALDEVDIPYTLTDEEPYDIIHINTIFLKSYLKAKKAKKEGKTVIYHAHSTKDDFRNSFIFANAFSSLFGWWIKKCYSTADLVLTPSEYSKSLLKKYGLKKPIEAISNGIDLSYWKSNSEEAAAFRDKYHIRPEEKLVISVGLPIKRKGILDFVKLARRFPDYQFIWFGYTNPVFLPKDVSAAIKTDLPNLQFPGYINREELRVAYQACDLYVFLTHEETEGIVLLEALASKADTLVRDIPVFNPDYINGENVYKGKNFEELTLMMEDLLEEKIPSLVDEGYKEVSKKSIKNIGLKLKKFYLKALNEKSNENFTNK